MDPFPGNLSNINCNGVFRRSSWSAWCWLTNEIRTPGDRLHSPSTGSRLPVNNFTRVVLPLPFSPRKTIRLFPSTPIPRSENHSPSGSGTHVLQRNEIARICPPHCSPRGSSWSSRRSWASSASASIVPVLYRLARLHFHLVDLRLRPAGSRGRVLLEFSTSAFVFSGAATLLTFRSARAASRASRASACLPQWPEHTMVTHIHLLQGCATAWSTHGDSLEGPNSEVVNARANQRTQHLINDLWFIQQQNAGPQQRRR